MSTTDASPEAKTTGPHATPPFSPNSTDVECLEGLLELVSEFSDNEQRARYLLSSDWLRERMGEPVEHDASARLFRQMDSELLHQMAHVAQWTLRQRAATTLVEHPSWCERGDGCSADYNPDDAPEDWMASHASRDIDRWMPFGGHEEIVVYVRGSRHPNAEDWPDTIMADGSVAIGEMGGIDLCIPDGRRLAQALLKACELAETDPAVVTEASR